MDDTVRDVARILEASGNQPLSVEEISHRFEELPGYATVARAVDALVRDGEAISSPKRGVQRYLKAEAPDGRAVSEAEEIRKAVADKPTITWRIHAVLHRMHPKPVEPAEVASILDLDRVQVSQALYRLRNNGHVARVTRDIGYGDTTGWTVTRLEGPEPDSQPNQDAPDETVKDVIQGHAAEPETPAKTLFCLRSDGALELRRASGTLELSREETTALMDYLEPWVIGQIQEVRHA